jgi:hypothetical protein
MSSITIPSDLKDRQAIKTALDQISTELAAMEECRVQVNNILTALEDKYKLPKKTFRKVAYMYHRQTVAQFEHEAAEIKEVYKSIFG